VDDLLFHFSNDIGQTLLLHLQSLQFDFVGFMLGFLL